MEWLQYILSSEIQVRIDQGIILKIVKLSKFNQENELK